MTNAPNLIYDGYTALHGVHGALRPIELERHQVHRAINTSFRGSIAKPRPGWEYQPLSFGQDSYLASVFHRGRFQAAGWYMPDRGVPFLLFLKGGRVFRVDILGGGQVTDITIQETLTLDVDFIAPAIGTNNTAVVPTTGNLRAGMSVRIGGYRYTIMAVLSVTDVELRNENDDSGDTYPVGAPLTYYDVNPGRFFRGWMEQAEKWMLIQDGESRCIIFDGAKCRRADHGEVPIGTAMAFGMGRLWVAGPDGRTFTAGDLIYGSSGTPGERYRDAVLKWTENTYLAGGGAFAVPFGTGQIRAMKFIAELDTALGQGPLQVFTTNGSFSIAAKIKRADWNGFSQDTTPIQTISLNHVGTESDRTVVPINSDLFFRARDGVRTFMIERRNAGTWANTPISSEIAWALNSDNPALLQYSSAVLHDRRYIMTCAPVITERGVIHQGVVALDMELVSWLDQRPPDWEGLWTCAHIYQLVAGLYEGTDHCFAICENGDSEVEIFEISKDRRYDQSSATEPTRIRWAIEFASIGFPRVDGSKGSFDLKNLFGGEMFVQELEGEVTFKVRYRPDGHPCWVPWHWWKECAEVGACERTDWTVCKDIGMAKPQNRGPMGFGQPPDVKDVGNGRPLRNLYAVQLRLDVRGYAELSGIRLAATMILQPMIEPPNPASKNLIHV